MHRSKPQCQRFLDDLFCIPLFFRRRRIYNPLEAIELDEVRIFMFLGMNIRDGLLTGL